jgi:hypothetical protein
MSKKKFTDGLESLFNVSDEEAVDHYGGVNMHTEQTTYAMDETIVEAIKPKRTGKDFSANLGSAMQDAFVTSEDAFLTQEENINLSEISKKASRKPLTGLDALLRRTIDSSELDNETKRRVVLIIESGKFEKLKEIAKEESLFLKDIIERSVSFFLDDYDRRKVMG